jgi:uncharacterized membrane protein (TIGR01666 family)
MNPVAESIQHNIAASGKTLKRFLFSQYFSDGIRITLGLLLPSVLFYQLGDINLGIAVSLGALCVSIPDNPGPYEHRRNAMLITIALIFGMALLTALFAKFAVLLTLFIGISCFLFSMMHVFGARAAAMGISSLAVMVLGIDQQLSLLQASNYALLVMLGGVWYFLLSLFSQKLMPYRAAEQILGECIFEVAKFIELKAGFYNAKIDIDEQYKKIIAQQAVVNEYQEHVREILFKTRKILVDSTPTGRTLLLTFIDLVDLYEQSMATHYNYADIHKAYAHTGILPHFENVIRQMSEEITHIGNNLHNHEDKNASKHFIPTLNLLKSKVDELETQGIKVHVLKRILINLRNISSRIERIHGYKESAQQLPSERSAELRKFVQPQTIDWNLFKANLTLASNHFRHAARMAIICMIGFVFARTIYNAEYSYWILLSIIVILKPGFSLTKKRNYERVIGTIAGGIVGLLILKYFPGIGPRFTFLTAFMILAFSFMRINYVVSVLFMTPYVLIVFSFTDTTNQFSVAWERILDTLIGAGLALGASYFIFPNWESYQLKDIMQKVLKANMGYLKSIAERNETQLSQSNYRLARKELYVQSSYLTTAFQRMLSEPKSKQKNANHVFQFSVLNNQLSSYFATLSYQLKPGEQLSDDDIRAIRSVYFILHEGLEKITNQQSSDAILSEIKFARGNHQYAATQPDLFIAMQQTATHIKKEIYHINFAE